MDEYSKPNKLLAWGIGIAALLASLALYKVWTVNPKLFSDHNIWFAIRVLLTLGAVGTWIKVARRDRLALEAKEREGRPPHIVSRGEYAINTSEKVTLSALGAVLCTLAYIGIASTTITALLCTVLFFTGGVEGLDAFRDAGIVLVMGVSSFVMLRFSRGSFTKSHSIDAGIPLTQAEMNDLPVPDTLVRASQEPLQLQQATLLRPAVEIPEAHEEQLLRAASEQE